MGRSSGSVFLKIGSSMFGFGRKAQVRSSVIMLKLAYGWPDLGRFMFEVRAFGGYSEVRGSVHH